MKIKVTYTTPINTQIVEIYDLTPHKNGFVPDYKLRALALNWTVIKVEEIKE